jgi:hypothetical protein
MQATYAYAVESRASRCLGAVSSFAALCALLAGGPALAQTHPSKPVRFLSGQPPGGATDLFARMVAQKLTDTWKQPVIVEHRTGSEVMQRIAAPMVGGMITRCLVQTYSSMRSIIRTRALSIS